MLSNYGAREDSWEFLGHKEIKAVNPKGNQPRIFIGRTDVEAEAPILWPPDEKSQLIGKDPDGGEDWRQEKEMTEDEMAGWHPWLNGHEFEQTLGDGKEQRSLACCSPWGHKELGMTERLNNDTTKAMRKASSFFFFFFFNERFVFVFWLAWVLVTVLSLSLVVVSGGNSSVVPGLLIAVASRCRAQAPGCAGFSSCSSQALEPVGSVVVVHGLSCSLACGIFPNQGSNPCPLCWQADS